MYFKIWGCVPTFKWTIDIKDIEKNRGFKNVSRNASMCFIRNNDSYVRDVLSTKPPNALTVCADHKAKG